MNSTYRLPVVAALLLSLLLLAGCNWLWVAPADAPNPAPTLAPSPTATPTPTPPPGVSKGEAEQVVRDYFAAMDRQDYDRMLALTSTQGTEVTEGLIDEIHRNEQANNVALAPRAESLEITRVEQRGQTAEVDVAFIVHIYASLGPVNVLARTTEGEATFVVARVDGAARIVSIEGDLHGLA